LQRAAIQWQKKTRNIELTQVTQWEDRKATSVEDYLAAEEPLEMRAGRYSLGVTLRTPGDEE
jgi:formate dehydrogenase assembly factor FdhD